MRFELTDLVPQLEWSGWVGWWIGLVVSFLALVVVHLCTVEERRKLRHSCMPPVEDKDDGEAGFEMVESDSAFQSRQGDSSKSRSARYCFIDFARGLAICFVTFFHYIWNLRHNNVMDYEPHMSDSHLLFLEIVEFWVFFGVSFLWLSETFHGSVFLGYLGFALVTAVCIMWHYWASQLSGVGMIMFCVGISSYVQNKDGIKWHKIVSRIKKLFLVSLAISIATFLLLPEAFIYFGAIHCITLVSILHLPFLRFPQLAIVGSVGIFLYKALFGDFPLEVPVFRATVDHMPWFGNLGYLLFGIFCGHIGIHRSTHYVRCLWGFLKPGIHLEDTVFPFLGRHSLFIFIAHQVVLFPIVKLATGNSLIP